MSNLKSILTDGFFPHYCPEYTLNVEDFEEARNGRPPMRATAMVSFCDLPLSLIRKHLDEYGDFGVGLRKEWGLRNGLTPVIYTHPNARTREPLLRLAAAANKDESVETRKDLMLLDAYTKPFSGFAWRNCAVQQDVRFYDEREWRFVPGNTASEPLFLERQDYINRSIIDGAHEQSRKTGSLKIHPDDIQYLIIPDDDHILELHQCLTHLYQPEDAILVTTAIMTRNCIDEDS